MANVLIDNVDTLQAMSVLTDWSGDTYSQIASMATEEGFCLIGDAVNIFNSSYFGQGYKITPSVEIFEDRYGLLPETHIDFPVIERKATPTKQGAHGGVSNSTFNQGL